MKNPIFPEEVLTERLIIRPLTVKNGNDWFKALRLAQKGLTTYMNNLPWVHFQEEEQIHDWVVNQHVNYLQNNSFRALFYLKDSPSEVVGVTRITAESWEHLRFDIGFWACEPYIGKGLISEGQKAVNDHLLSLGARRISAIVRPDNQRSLATLTRMGFQKEGKLLNYGPKNDRGFPTEVYLYALYGKDEIQA